jgi:hypothetical protein
MSQTDGSTQVNEITKKEMSDGRGREEEWKKSIVID